jgi:UDP-4-amino-4,6-dideoxy-N-acetyl-beta-L-altrosamine transaminase
MIPYGRHAINEEDIRDTSEVLKGDFLTTGPKIREFEERLCKYLGCKYAVVVNSGTAALHLSCLAAGLKENEELITSPITFAASANCAFYCNAKPVFVDVKENGIIDENKIERVINKKTKIIIPVHYSGLCCEMKKIKEIANKNNLIIIEDACHALGGDYKDSKIGSCKYSDMCVFSFHPVKHITTGEGGAITTNSKELYEKLKMLRNHGIEKGKKQSEKGGWYYEIEELGYNYRITDFQCALGISQLNKIDDFIKKRREIARVYDEFFKKFKNIEVLKGKSAYHLYVIKVKESSMRLELFNFLKERGINCQVHYIPVYFHPYYRKKGYKKGICPNAEKFYERIISLPIFVKLSKREQDFVINNINEFIRSNGE